MKKGFALLLFSFFSIFIFAQSGKDLIKVTDLLKIKSISAVTLTKDATKAAFVITSIEPDGDSKYDYKYNSQIYIVPADGSSAPKQLTTKESSSQPAWSPEGKTIAFVRAADGKPQIFLLSLDGGEAMQLTRFRYGAGTPTWSPDGKQLLFSSNILLKDLIKDSLLNPSHSVPSWSYEKPGFDKNDYLKNA